MDIVLSFLKLYTNLWTSLSWDGSRIFCERGRWPSDVCQDIILPNFPKKRIEVRNFWSMGKGGGRSFIRHCLQRSYSEWAGPHFTCVNGEYLGHFELMPPCRPNCSPFHVVFRELATCMVGALPDPNSRGYLPASTSATRVLHVTYTG